MSMVQEGMGRPDVSFTVQRTSRGVPLGSVCRIEPWESSRASCVWKGPRTVPVVEAGSLGRSMESISRERPRMSERRINSW